VRQNLIKLNWLKPLLLAILVGGMATWVWTSDLKAWIEPDRITRFLEGFGIFAPLVFMLVMAGAVVVSPIPSVPLDAAAGAIFGPFLGTVYALLGAETGALISFLITRT